MAEKKKIKGLKKWLKENGYTEEQMQAFWDELIPINKTIAAMNRVGLNWDETNTSILAQLPTAKEATLKRIEEDKATKEEAIKKAEKDKADKEYYEANFEEIILNKIDNKEALTEKEIRELIEEYEVDTKAKGKMRWQMPVTTIVKLSDRHFAIDWYEGLTEEQPNDYSNQPYEVEKTEKVVVITNWERI